MLHVISSVGWIGAVMAALCLAILGLAAADEQTTRSAAMTLDAVAWFVLVPLGVASLVSGLVQSIGTTWGIARHYWVLFKLVINAFCIIVLLAYTKTLTGVANAARTSSASLADVRNPSAVLHGGLALALLVAAAVLSIYKPPGVTPWADRARRAVD